MLAQCKMYIAALRIADEFGCDAIGIQYQQGLKDLAPASDLVEGLLNNVDRPPVTARGNGGCCMRARRCRTSTKWTSAPASTRWSPTASGRAGLRAREHAARHALRRSVPVNGNEFVWVLPDLRRRAAGALHRRLRRRGQRTPAADVLPPGRRHAEGRQQAGRDRLEPHLRRRRRAEGGHRPRQGGRAARGRDRAPLADDDPAVADHARGHSTASRATR